MIKLHLVNLMENHLNTTAEKKQANTIVPKVETNSLQNAISALDEEMKATLKNAVDQLVPGASFNPVLVKEISKIETRKIRLITGRLDALIRKGNPEVKDVVDRLLAIAI